MSTESIASRLTEGVKNKSEKLSVYIDEDLMRFLTVSSVVMSIRESKKAYEQAKKGKRNIRATKHIESREGARCIEIICQLSKRSGEEAIEDVGTRMNALLDAEEAILKATGAKTLSSAVALIEDKMKG